MFVVNNVYVDVSNRISEEHIEEFEKDFGYQMTLEEVSFDEDGKKSEFKYRCGHERLDDFKSYINDWLRQHSFPRGYVTVMRDLSLNVDEELSDSQIQDFEEEFEVKCRGYSKSCGYGSIKYSFA